MRPVGCSSLAAIVSLFLAFPVALQGEEPEAPDRIRFYPLADFTFDGGTSAPANLWAVLVPEETWKNSGLPAAAARQGDGRFHFQLQCPFVGQGVLRIVASPDPDAQAITTVSIDCAFGNPEVPAAESSARVSSLSPGEEEIAITGRAHSFVLRSSSAQSFRFRTTQCNDVVVVNEGSRQTSTESTLQDGVVCVVDRVNGVEVRRCFSWLPDFVFPGTFFQEGLRTTNQSETFALCDPRVPDSPKERTFTSSFVADVDFEGVVAFPNVPAGSVADSIKAEAIGGGFRASLPVSDFKINGITPTFTGAGQPFVNGSHCLQNVSSPPFGVGGQSSFEWLDDAPILGAENRYEFSIPVTASCAINALPFETVQTGAQLGLSHQTNLNLAGIVFTGRFRPSLLTLVLEPSDPSVFPSWEHRPSDPNVLGNSSTEITASILGGEEAVTYTIEIVVDDFDSQLSGHEHGTPTGRPQRIAMRTDRRGRQLTSHNWGELGGDFGDNLDRKPTATCEVTADASGMGACVVEYQAGPVSGTAKFLATIVAEDGQPRSGSPVTGLAEAVVGVSGLGSVRALFARPSELCVSDLQPHPEPWNGTPLTAEAMTKLQAAWESATHVIAVTGPPPPGGWPELPPTYLSFNDVSLPRGGVLDFEKTWIGPHAEHRDGKAVDINRQLRRSCREGAAGCTVGAQIAAEINLDGIANQLIDDVRRACERAGLSMYSQGQDPGSLHCFHHQEPWMIGRSMLAFAALATSLPAIAQSEGAPIVLEPLRDVRIDSLALREGEALRFVYQVSSADSRNRSVYVLQMPLGTDASRSEVSTGGLSDSGASSPITQVNRTDLGGEVTGVTFPSRPEAWSADLTADGRAYWQANYRDAGVHSGETVSGFALLSRGVPGIRVAKLEVPREHEIGQYVHDIPDFEIAEALAQADFTASVVAPVGPLANATPAAVATEVEALRQQARTIGWIRTDAAAESLRAKLATLSSALAQNDFPVAKRTARAFLDEVVATGCTTFSCAPEKALTAEAYALLFFNAEYLRGLIPNSPPSCATAVASPNLFWPPNHEMVDVGVAGVTDPDGDQITTRWTSVTQDEHVLEPGSGNHCPDAELISPNGGLRLRAERAGRLNGRVYRLQFEATDDAEASCTGTVKVCMPHEESTVPSCIEDAAVHDSFVCP